MISRKNELHQTLLGRRVVSVELASRIRDVGCLEKKMVDEYQAMRLRICRRLRKHRQRVAQAVRLERLMAAGYAFARDQAAWQRWHESMRLALERAVADVGLALPRGALLEKQVEKAICQASLNSVPLTVHVNSRTHPAVQTLLSTLRWPGETMMHAVVITEYLEDDSCIIETPNGVFEANAVIEVEAFGSGVKAFMEGIAPVPGSGRAT